MIDVIVNGHLGEDLAERRQILHDALRIRGLLFGSGSRRVCRPLSGPSITGPIQAFFGRIRRRDDRSPVADASREHYALAKAPVALLVPQSFEDLLVRMYAEHGSLRSHLRPPRRRGRCGAGRPPGHVRLSVLNHGARAATGLGPAAGPQSQLAQNILLSWLGGSRVLELKTVQILDRLEIGPPVHRCTERRIPTSNGRRSSRSRNRSVSTSSGGTSSTPLRSSSVCRPRPAPRSSTSPSVTRSTGSARTLCAAGSIASATRNHSWTPRAMRCRAGLRARIGDTRGQRARSMTAVTLSTFHGLPSRRDRTHLRAPLRGSRRQRRRRR